MPTFAGNESVQSVTLTALWEATGYPCGEIRIDERNVWQKFLNIISFGLFFREEKTVTVTAWDVNGEDVAVEYFIGDRMYFTETGAVIPLLPTPAYRY